MCDDSALFAYYQAQLNHKNATKSWYIYCIGSKLWHIKTEYITIKALWGFLNRYIKGICVYDIVYKSNVINNIWLWTWKAITWGYAKNMGTVYTMYIIYLVS